MASLSVLGAQTVSALWYIGAAVLVVAFVSLLRVGRRPGDLPPGPKTLPVVGNLHQIAKRNVHQQFQAWAAQYGPVFSIMLGPQPVVVLSSDAAVREVLDKQSAVTNGCGDHYIGHQILGGGEHILLMPDGPKWQLQQKLMQKMLDADACRSYLPYTLLESKQMLHDLLHTPDDFIDHIKRYSNSTFLSITYGRRWPLSTDPTMRQFVASVDKKMSLLQSRSAALLDVYPVLRCLPDSMVPVRAEARACHKAQTAFFLRQWTDVRARGAAAAPPPCIARALQRDQKQEGFSDRFGAILAGSALEAGAAVAANELVAFVQAMLLFPDAQRAAQAELDRVVGAARLPAVDDAPALPYVRACVRETLRWFPAAVLGGAPHAATADLPYNGRRIPAGAWLVHNVYAIHNDPARHADPRVFRPERYLGGGGDDGDDEDAAAATTARRLCAGLPVVEQALFVGIARLLWAFAVEAPIDFFTNTPIEPNPDRYTQAVVCMPEPFRASIRPRAAERAALIEAEWAAAQAAALDDADKQWRGGGKGL